MCVEMYLVEGRVIGDQVDAPELEHVHIYGQNEREIKKDK